MLANLSSILGAAVEDGLIARNPCASRAVRAPKVEQSKIVPWPAERVARVIDAHPERWRAVPVVAAGCGLRQGEVFGIKVDDVDFLGRRLRVRHQIKLVGGTLIVAPPKGAKTREVPLPEPVALELAEHLRRYPAIDGFVFSTRERTRVNRQHTRLEACASSRERRGQPSERHARAPSLVRERPARAQHGTSIRSLADYLGHADPGFMLRTYTHLMPTSGDRARQAMETALASLADYPRTGAASEA